MHPRALAAAAACVLLLAGCGPAETPTARTSVAVGPTTSAAAGASVSAVPSPAGSPVSGVRAAPVPSITVPAQLSSPGRDEPVLGGDVSWPQCPEGTGIPEKQGQGAPAPLPSAAYVVLGLTDGPSFTPNPCLVDQVGYVKRRGLLAAAYAVHSYPDAATLRRYGGDGPYDEDTAPGRLSNTGWAQARYALDVMQRADLTTPVIWVDVEPVPEFDWSQDTAANAAVVRGAVRAYQDAGFGVGVYSTPSLWNVVVGDLALGLPEWRAAGRTSVAEALRHCGSDATFQGGSAVLSQWVDGARDRDVTCPGTSVHLEAWFHRY